jgi:hypothetical protein
MAYYRTRRTNYVYVFGAATSVCLLRNPLGTFSLGLLGLGAALFLDAVASAASARALAVVGHLNPRLAVKIRGQPGGHDGTTCARRLSLLLAAPQ